MCALVSWFTENISVYKHPIILLRNVGFLFSPFRNMLMLLISFYSKKKKQGFYKKNLKFKKSITYISSFKVHVYVINISTFFLQSNNIRIYIF